MPPTRSSQTTDLQQWLRETPDTVTHILEVVTGESIVADVVCQSPIVAGEDNVLGVRAGHLLTHRIAVLRGEASERAYVYAETDFVPDRLPKKALGQLECTSEPIGRILLGEGLAMDRRAWPRPERPDPAPAGTVDEGDNEVIWARAYLLALDDLPAFAIREWFFGSVLDPFDRSGPASSSVGAPYPH